MDLETRFANAPTTHSAATTALSSPNLVAQDAALDEVADDMMMVDSAGGANPLGLAASNFKKQVIKNSKGKVFWENFPDGAPPRITPPPPSFGSHRGSSSVMSQDDVSMDSPSASASSQNPFVLPGPATTTSSSGGGTPQPQPLSQVSTNGTTGINPPVGLPSAIEITRRINSKRRRDDDFDPVSFKRRAVSPGMSVHNSPIMQSPLQRDMAPWGTAGSRPGSVGGDTTGKSGGSGSENGSQGNGNRVGGAKGRVGFQGMVDTNDGITKLSIE